MGVKDTVTIRYLRQNDIFADAFNYFIYNGRKVIVPERLEELDTREVDVPYGGENGAEQPVQKTRDVIKTLMAMTDGRAAYLVLAIEAQSNIHYAMAVKNMVYDALQYAKQVEEAIASHRASGDYKNVGSDEYLSGFMKQDRLMPVVTLVIYFDSKKWDGPRTIHEMFSVQDEELLSYVPDYKINLIEPAMMQKEDFDKFSTTLKEVLTFIKYSKDADGLKEALDADPNFHHLGREEVDVLNACVNADLHLSESEATIDVCEAIRVLNQRAADEAAEKATEKAMEKAEKKRITTLVESINNLKKNMGWTSEKAMEILGLSESDRKAAAPFL